MPYIPGFPSILFHEVWHLPSTFALQKLVKDFGGQVDRHRLPREKNVGNKGDGTTGRNIQRIHVVIPLSCGKVVFELLTLESNGEKIYLLSDPIEDCLNTVAREKMGSIFLDLCDGSVSPSSYTSMTLIERLQTLEKKIQEQRELLRALQ